MKHELLKHIQALSNSKLQQISALETFAKCFNAIYGDCAFISLDICPDSGLCQVRLVFRTDEQHTPHFDNFMDSEQYINNPQLNDIVQQGTPQIVQQLQDELLAVLQSYQLPTQSMMAIPIYLDGIIARWVLVLGPQASQFADVDLEQAILLANLAGTYMARIDETEALARANTWIEKELDDIARIHQLLLPQEKVKLQGTEYAAFFKSCDKAGGDYYDIVNLSAMYGGSSNGQDMWGAIVADASGHGAAAAVEVAMFDAILRTYHGTIEAGPANVLNYTNRYSFTRKLRGSFMTAAIVNYNPENRTLTYANAGHPPIMLLQPGEKLQHLDDQAGIPLGVQPDWQWQNVGVTVKPGTLVMMYTDGIVEALSADKQQFGVARLESIIKNPVDKVVDYVEQVRVALRQHQGDMPQADDQALLVFRIE